MGLSQASRPMISTLLAASLGFSATPALAQEIFAAASIGDSSLKDVTGAALVNQSAGEGNIQFNGAIISFNATDAARTKASVVQLSGAYGDESVLVAIARIGDEAFAGARGSVLVTQAAGISNLQVNLFAAAFGLNGEIALEAELSQTHASRPLPEDYQAEGGRFVQVSSGAFRDAAGIIQVNQVAGRENATFNRFALGIDAGSLP